MMAESSPSDTSGCEEELYLHGPVQAIMTLYPNLATLPRMPPLPSHQKSTSEEDSSGGDQSHKPSAASASSSVPSWVGYRCGAELWQRRKPESAGSMYTQRRHHAGRSWWNSAAQVCLRSTSAKSLGTTTHCATVKSKGRWNWQI